MNSRTKAATAAMLAALTLGSAPVAADQPAGSFQLAQGYGMGPGMMGGYGPGAGSDEQREYGPGYGRRGGSRGNSGRGYGPGYGMGPGMMGGYGPGYGMGPGMMGGYGPGYGMGPGMMGGYGPGYGGGPHGGIDLSEKQREQLGKIQQDIAREHWDLMGKMHDEQYKLSELYGAPKRDDAAIEKSFKRMEDLRRQMFDSMADARKKMDGVLTSEQKERAWRNGPRW